MTRRTVRENVRLDDDFVALFQADFGLVVVGEYAVLDQEAAYVAPGPGGHHPVDPSGQHAHATADADALRVVRFLPAG